VLPHIPYCNLIWGRNYEVHLHPIIILQKRIIRIISSAQYRAHSGPLFKAFNPLKFTDINKLQLAEFMYKYYNSMLPESFNRYFIYNNEVHGHNTRRRHDIHVEPFRLTRTGFSVKIAGPQLWNSLPLDLKNSKSVNIFKKKIQ